MKFIFSLIHFVWFTQLSNMIDWVLFGRGNLVPIFVGLSLCLCYRIEEVFSYSRFGERLKYVATAEYKTTNTITQFKQYTHTHTNIFLIYVRTESEQFYVNIIYLVNYIQTPSLVSLKNKQIRRFVWRCCYTKHAITRYLINQQTASVALWTMKVRYDY